LVLGGKNGRVKGGGGRKGEASKNKKKVPTSEGHFPHLNEKGKGSISRGEGDESISKKKKKLSSRGEKPRIVFL